MAERIVLLMQFLDIHAVRVRYAQLSLCPRFRGRRLPFGISHSFSRFCNFSLRYRVAVEKPSGGFSAKSDQLTTGTYAVRAYTLVRIPA